MEGDGVRAVGDDRQGLRAVKIRMAGGELPTVGSEQIVVCLCGADPVAHEAEASEARLDRSLRLLTSAATPAKVETVWISAP